MVDPDCVFCKIIQKEIPSNIIKENDHVMVVEDIAPKAPFHYLILPKKHIININYLEDQDLKYMSEIFKMARDVAKDIQEATKSKEHVAFNLLSNNEVEAGQSVFHMHFHFISGKNIYINGLEL
jgi:histidine triad (HIT) family protein